jgi:RNA polymerase sigma-70 factor (ECF subfamily)
LAQWQEKTDEELISELQKGDLEAFTLLYARYQKRLYNFLLRLLGDRDRAEELFQETMLRVYLHRRSYLPHATFRTWLYTIARHLCLNLLAREKKERLAPGPPSLHLQADPSFNPEQRLELVEQEEAVRQAILSLPLPQREVIILTRFEGLSYREVAQILSKSESAVRVIAHRALLTLQEYFRTRED